MPVTTPTAKLRPKIFAQNPRGKVVLLIAGPEGTPLPVNQEPGQPHRQLGKQVVIREREAELKAAPKGGIGDGLIHALTLQSDRRGVIRHAVRKFWQEIVDVDRRPVHTNWFVCY